MRSTLDTLGDLLLLNDAYNANPASAREALVTLDAIGGERPRVAVLGSMLELGAQGPALHDEIAARALASKAMLIAGIGEFVGCAALPVSRRRSRTQRTTSPPSPLLSSRPLEPQCCTSSSVASSRIFRRSG
ncbi:MAG: hypothetical protein IPF47_21430 [Gemmatimonadetes bacterium]|nr:hypothetical protein [Gemmatimonadota bacterium]